jgi:hypothetical protein
MFKKGSSHPGRVPPIFERRSNTRENPASPGSRGCPMVSSSVVVVWQLAVRGGRHRLVEVSPATLSRSAWAVELALRAERQRLGPEPLPPRDGGGTLGELRRWWVETYVDSAPAGERTRNSPLVPLGVDRGLSTQPRVSGSGRPHDDDGHTARGSGCYPNRSDDRATRG